MKKKNKRTKFEKSKLGSVSLGKIKRMTAFKQISSFLNSFKDFYASYIPYGWPNF